MATERSLGKDKVKCRRLKAGRRLKKGSTLSEITFISIHFIVGFDFTKGKKKKKRTEVELIRFMLHQSSIYAG